MDTKAWAFLRAYILDYIVGILWILPVVIGLSSSQFAALGRFFVAFKTALGPLTPTDFVIGFITVIAGVVVPYCVTMLITPTVYLVTATLFSLQGLIWRKHSLVDTKLEDDARKRWTLDADIPFSDRTKIMLLRSVNATAADELSGHLDNLSFKSQVLAPTALLLAVVLHRLGVSGCIANTVAVVEFLVGDIAANGNAYTWRRRLHVAIVKL